MPPATYPVEITFYILVDDDNLTDLEVADEVQNLGNLLSSLRANENENQWRAKAAIKLSEALESLLATSEMATFYVSFDNYDCFGNTRPYDIDFLRIFDIALCEQPFMGLGFLRDLNEIDDFYDSLTKLSEHDYFGGDNYIHDVISLFDTVASMKRNQDECAVVSILKTYDLY